MASRRSSHEVRAANRIAALLRRHPALFADRPFEIPGPFLGAGWLAIADAMCTDLERILGDAAKRWRPIQSKEKWSAWRLYWALDASSDEAGDTRDTPFDMDIIGGTLKWPTPDDHELAETVAGVRLTTLPSGALRRAVHARVRAAEEATAKTCMWCGQPGRQWTNGWVHTACDRHRRANAITLDAAREVAKQRSRKKQGDGNGA